MLWLVAISCLVAWLLGASTSHTLGGLLHVLLVVAALAALVRVLRGPGPARAPPRRGSFEDYLRRK